MTIVLERMRIKVCRFYSVRCLCSSTSTDYAYPNTCFHVGLKEGRVFQALAMGLAMSMGRTHVETLNFHLR